MPMPLRDLRMDAGLSQAELARRAGVHPLTVTAIEVGRRPRPHPSTRKKIADALGVRVRDIAEFVESGEDDDGVAAHH